MKNIYLFLLIIFLSVKSEAQSIPQCDSLTIQCCTFDSVLPNTLTIYVSNPSTVLFDYPGFVLFNAAMDTIAKEQVTYFGISSSSQSHTMEIVAPLTLPFNGYLNLYILFYDTLSCSFPFSIPDTVSAIAEESKENFINVFPVPATGELTVELMQHVYGEKSSLAIINVFGEKVYENQFQKPAMNISLKKITPGVYFLIVSDSQKQIKGRKKIIVD